VDDRLLEVVENTNLQRRPQPDTADHCRQHEREKPVVEGGRPAAQRAVHDPAIGRDRGQEAFNLRLRQSSTAVFGPGGNERPVLRIGESGLKGLDDEPAGWKVGAAEYPEGKEQDRRVRRPCSVDSIGDHCGCPRDVPGVH